jgi:hypothetical protein
VRPPGRPDLRAAPRQLRPRPSLLAWVAYALDPGHSKVIRRALIEAAGGAGALAEDGHWGRRRLRLVNEALLRGHMRLPPDLQRRIALHQQASALRGRAYSILDRPGALDNARQLDVALALMDQASRAREEAGGLIGIHAGRRRLTYGLDL